MYCIFNLLYWLKCKSSIIDTLNDFEFISQLNKFSDTNYANAIIQKIDNNLDYINSSLVTFVIIT